MPVQSRYLFIAAMDVDADKEALFNEVYDREHIPELQKVPGVGAITRCKGQPFALSIGGETLPMAHQGPSYFAIYEIDSPEVVASAAWAKAVEKGRWAAEVRPFTRNRRHVVMKVA